MYAGHTWFCTVPMTENTCIYKTVASLNNVKGLWGSPKNKYSFHCLCFLAIWAGPPPLRFSYCGCFFTQLGRLVNGTGPGRRASPTILMQIPGTHSIPGASAGEWAPCGVTAENPGHLCTRRLLITINMCIFSNRKTYKNT